MVANRRVGTPHAALVVGFFLASLVLALISGSTQSRAAFAGSNGLIAYMEPMTNQGGLFFSSDISASDGTGAGKAPLTETDNAELNPNFGPDGDIVYMRSSVPVRSPADTAQIEIWTMNEDGSGQARVTSGHNDGSPAFSPDGSKIVFLRDGVGLVIANRDGTNITPVSNSTLGANEPVFSPDGQRILFSMHDGSDTEIYSIAKNGTDLVQLTNNSAGDANPDYSPDGTHIVFSSDRLSTTGINSIFVMNADGSNQTKLANGSGTGGWRQPCFSPDGTQIAFQASQGVAVMSADGANPHVIVPGAAAAPTWGPPDPTPKPPVASIAAEPGNVLEGDQTRFDASGSRPAAGAAGVIITDYRWDLDGDGDFEKDTGSVPTASRSYGQAGPVKPTVKVTSSQGLSDTATTTVNVLPKSRPGSLGVSINSGDQYTNDPNVVISARWPDYTSQLKLANDGGFIPSDVKGIGDFTKWKLDSSGPERLPKTVYVRFLQDGNEGLTTYQDDIILDETAPVITSASTAPGGSSNRALARGAKGRLVKVKVKVKAKDKTSGIKRVQVANSKSRHAKWMKFKPTVSFKSKGKAVFVRVQDGAGNPSGWKRAG